MATTIAELVASISVDDSGFKRGLDRVEQGINGVGSRMSSIGSMVGGALKVATGATVALAGGLTAIAGSGVKAATDFESAFTGVIKTVDATDAELAELRQGILDMSLELPDSASNIAAVAEAAGQLGIEVPNIMGFTRVMSDLGVATNLSSDEAATALARLANITGMSQTDFDRLGSTIVALGNNLATTEAEIVEMALRIAGAGSQIGLTEAQILSFAGSLSSVGINAEAGGSAISRVMIDIASAVSTGSDELDLFSSVAGMSIDQFRAAFQQDAAGAVLSFIEGLDRISQAGGNVFGVLDELGLSEIRVRDALLRASGAGDLFRSSLELGNSAWEENNALTKEAELRYSTTESKLKLFRNAIDAVRIGIGDKFLPVLGDVTGWATEFVKKHGPGVVDFFGRFAERLSAFISSAGTMLNRLTTTFSLNFSILTSENASWGEKMLAIWDMLYVVGLQIWQSLFDGLLTLIPQWLENLGEWALALWEWIKEATPKALEKLGEWAVALWDWLITNLPTWAANLWEWAKATWQWIVDVTPTALEKLGEWGMALINFLGANLPGWIATFFEWGAALWTWIGRAIPDAINGLAAFIAALRGEGDTSGLGEIGQMVAGWARTLWKWITEDALPEIAPSFATFLNAVVSAGGKILSALGNLAVELGKTLWHWITIAAPIAGNLLSALGTNLANIITSWVPQFGPGITALWMAIHSLFIAGSNALQGNWRGAWENIKNTGTYMWNAIEIAMQPIQTWLDKVSGGFLNWKDIITGAFVALALSGSGAMNGLLKVLGMFVPGLNLVVAGFGRFLAAAAPFLGWFALAIAAIVAFRVAWENDWLGIQTAGTKAMDILGKAFGPLLSTIQEFGGQALQELIAWVTGTETEFEAVNKIIDAAIWTWWTLYEGVSRAIGEAASVVSEWFEQNFPKSSKVLRGAVDEIEERFGELWEELKVLWTDTIGGWDGVVKAIERGQKLIDNILGILIVAIETFITNAILILTMFAQMLNGDWTGAWETAKKVVANTLDGLVEVVNRALDTILELFGLTREDLIFWFQDTRGMLRASAEQFRQWARDVTQPLRDFGNRLAEMGRNMVDTARGWVDKFVSAGRSAIDGLWRGIKQGWDAMTSPLRALWNSLPAGLRKMLESHSPSRVFADIGVDIVAGLAQGISKAQSMATEAIGGLSTELTSSAYVPPPNTSQAVTDTGRMEQLLEILIAELRQKNMTTNVTVAGGGSDIATLNGFTARLAG